MSNDAKAVSQYSLDNLTICKADGTQVNLGRPGTLTFRFRHWRYCRKFNKEN